MLTYCADPLAQLVLPDTYNQGTNNGSETERGLAGIQTVAYRIQVVSTKISHGVLLASPKGHQSSPHCRCSECGCVCARSSPRIVFHGRLRVVELLRSVL